MVDKLHKDSENPPSVANSGEKTDSNSSEILDLSCKRSTQSPDIPNLDSVPTIQCSKVDKQQLVQQPDVNNIQLAPINLHMEIETAKFENQKLPQKRKEQTNNDSQINYYQINNVQINDQIDNDRFRNNQINVDQMLHEPLKNDQVDRDYNSTNQVIAIDINSNTSHRDSLLSIGQQTLQQHSISMSKPINIPYMPTNIPIQNTHPLQLPIAMSIQEMEKSTMLTSITNASRPFKVYPKDPLVLSAGNKDTSDAYNKFRKSVLQNVKQTEREGTNSKMRRISNESSSLQSSAENTEKTRAYMEKRKKNNAAAKKSRDARRAKEDEIAIRAAYLEQENSSLRQMLQMVVKQLQEQNVQFDFRPVIETNENALGSGKVNSSS